MSEEKSTVGCSCASCPEMGNPDSYVSHLQAALRWHDEHVPRPTNPRNTCVVLKGKNKPDAVLFIHDEGGEVTHYLPEGAGTCQIETTESWLPAERYHRCKHCGAFFAVLDASNDIPPRACPNCGRKVVSE